MREIFGDPCFMVGRKLKGHQTSQRVHKEIMGLEQNTEHKSLVRSGGGTQHKPERSDTKTQIADGRGLNCRWVFLYLANTKLSKRNLRLVVFMEPTILPYDNTQLYIACLRDLQFASCIWGKLIRTHLIQIDLFLFSSPHNKCSIQD